jgi:DHA1 family tetracycline resistance protein-like MFS transporter
MKVNGLANGRLWLIAGIILLNGIGMTIVFPLLPFLIGKYFPASQVVVGMSVFASAYALCAFFAAPFFGAMSDSNGRKIVLVISLLGSVAGYVLLGVGGALWVLLLGRIIDGLTAGNISTLFAYIADSTKPAERTKWFGYVGGAMGIGTMIGPAIGGSLSVISISAPFFVTAGIFAVCAVTTCFFLPESLPSENRAKTFSLKSINIFTGFRDLFLIKNIKELFLIGGFFYASLETYQFNFSVFAKDVYLWGPTVIGAMLSIAGVCDIASRALLLPALLKKHSEKNIGTFGLLGLCIGLACLLLSFFVSSIFLVAISIIFITFGEGLFDPTYNGRLSNSVKEVDQGKLQGANQSLQSAYRVIVPIVAAAIYYFGSYILYVVATFAAISALVLFLKFTSREALGFMKEQVQLL